MKKFTKFLNESSKMPLNVRIGDVLQVQGGTVKITDIEISSFHVKNPIVYIHYEYAIKEGDEVHKGKEKNQISTFKELF